MKEKPSCEYFIEKEDTYKKNDIQASCKKEERPDLEVRIPDHRRYIERSGFLLSGKVKIKK